MSDCNGARRYEAAIADTVCLAPYRTPRDGGGHDLSTAMDGVCLGDAGAGGTVTAAAVLATTPHVGPLQRTLRAIELGALLRQQLANSGFGQRLVARYQLDGRVRAGQVALRGARSD